MQVLIIGAGMSGLCMAIELQRAGIEFQILEKAPQLGGTWWDNTYPGCACDIPSHLYGFSFAPKHDWTRVYPSQPEILAYLEELARERGLLERIRFGVEVVEARYDEARGEWTVALADGETLTAPVLVSAVGALHVPNYPDLPGRQRFQGPAFHSARWDHGVDLAGKRVGVIGNAASAVQLVPEVAKVAERLTVFQRTPHWVLPRFDRPYARWQQALLRLRPLWRLYRWTLYLRQELLFLLVFRQGARGGRLLRRALTRHIRSQVRDPALWEPLTPDYALGCKRGLLSNDYYPALNRENVELVTEPLQAIEERGVRTDRRALELDVLIYATGFQPLESWGGLKVVGRDGEELGQRWGRSPRAHLGICVPGYPNFFLLLGPNTGLGHNSVMWMVECQVHYVMRCLRQLQRRRLRSLEVTPAALERFYALLERRMSDKVWTTCRSWYRNEDGVVFALWPSSTARYWWETRRPRWRDFDLVP